MQINGLQHTQAAQSLGAASRSAGAPRTSAPASTQSALPTDELDLSAEAQAISQTQATQETSGADGIRWDKVNSLRQAIANGNYDTPERMSAAIDNMLDAFA